MTFSLQRGRPGAHVHAFPVRFGSRHREGAPHDCLSHGEAVGIHGFLFSFLPLPPALQIYEESKMNLEQERPFVCSAPGCSQVSVGARCSVFQGRAYLPRGKQLSLAVTPASGFPSSPRYLQSPPHHHHHCHHCCYFSF